MGLLKKNAKLRYNAKGCFSSEQKKVGGTVLLIPPHPSLKSEIHFPPFNVFIFKTNDLRAPCISDINFFPFPGV